MQRDGLTASHTGSSIEVILQVLPTPLRSATTGMSKRLSSAASPMPDKSKVCGRVHRAAGQHHLARSRTRTGCLFCTNSTPTTRVPSNRMRVTCALDFDRQILALQRRRQIGARRAPALALMDGELIRPEAFLRIAVEIAASGESPPRRRPGRRRGTADWRTCRWTRAAVLRRRGSRRRHSRCARRA